MNTLYIRSLKISVTAGSFITYDDSRSGDGEGSQKVGRIVEVVTSIDLVPHRERHPLIQEYHAAASQDRSASQNDFPVQFAKVNVFEDRKFFTGCHFPESDDRYEGWNRIVQVNKFFWMPSYCIGGLASVAFENDDSLDDHCLKGMTNFFVVKYRISGDGEEVSVIPPHAFPPFPGQIKRFQNVWSVDYCKLTFNVICQVRQEMQRILCRVAQSQGDFTLKTSKMQLPSCSWHFIKKAMAAGGVKSICDVKYSHPHAFLSWGLVYNSRRCTRYVDVLRFDTPKKLDVFCSLFGTSMAGYGVRKKRPRYSDAPFPLAVHDVVNAVCPSETTDAEDDESECLSGSLFQRVGIPEDGIDFTYDSTEGTLLITLRHQKVVVSNESLTLLAGAGVRESGACRDLSNSADRISNIIPGMEFIDGTYMMRVHEVRRSGVIHAMKAYKILAQGTTAKVYPLEIVVYSDVETVYRKIQAMLE